MENFSLQGTVLIHGTDHEYMVLIMSTAGPAAGEAKLALLQSEAEAGYSCTVSAEQREKSTWNVVLPFRQKADGTLCGGAV